MKTRIFIALFVGFISLPIFAYAQGAVFSEYKFVGGLEPNADLACISIKEVTNQFNPPALVLAAKKCLQQEQYAKAWMILRVANAFGQYDLRRLADVSTRGALQVLIINSFDSFTSTELEKAQAMIDKFSSDFEQVNLFCTELTRIGPPAYDPTWAILHGLGVYHEQHNGPYAVNVDLEALWKKVLNAGCSLKKADAQEK